jgi:hypothetical protein
MPSLARDALRYRRTAVFAGLVAAGMALPLPAQPSQNWVVTNCDDDNSNGGQGPVGSLRHAVAQAASLDTIDMTGLDCTITLQAGAIQIPQNTLTLTGPGVDHLTIVATAGNRVLNNTNIGSLFISGLTVTLGSIHLASGNAYGGCIYSGGTVDFRHAAATYCSVRTDSGKSGGGAIYAKTGMDLRYCTLDHNNAFGFGYGGGARSSNSLSLKYCTVSHNSALIGGGISGTGNVTVTSSTIVANTAGRSGAIDAFNLTPTGKILTLVNSTISGNSASSRVGGVFANTPTVNVRNSTIAFNTAAGGKSGMTTYGVGLTVQAAPNSVTLNLDSSLIANNAYASTPLDFSVILGIGKSITTNGAHDLVYATSDTVPGGTMQHTCPLLGPLRNNGGPTATHALLSGSPAIDAGSNPANKDEDQRGIDIDTAPLPYPRVVGPAADIGAFEVHPDDAVFSAGFEGCLP